MNFKLPQLTPDTRNKLAFTCSLLYLLLIPINIQIKGQFYAHDLLAPIMLILVMLKYNNRKRQLTTPPLLLASFLLLIFLLTIFHYKSSADIYELGIFVYMGVLFMFFRNHPLSRRCLQYYGVTILVLIFLYLPFSIIFEFSKHHDIYISSSLSLLVDRFFFTFNHPNHAGSFYVLPITCITLGYYTVLQNMPPRRFILALALILILCIPLALTASKYMLLSFALIAAIIYNRKELISFQFAKAAIWGSLLLIFILFYLTILFPFFPLKPEFPFINMETAGMYTIHQKIYLQMITQDWKSLLFGIGRSGVFELYPQFSDWDSAYAILSQYNETRLTSSFTNYMDAHNEYLNIGASFGILAVTLLYAFLYKSKNLIKVSLPARQILLFFIAALFMVSFWGDILSKRWIWVSLGIIVSQLEMLSSDTRKI